MKLETITKVSKYILIIICSLILFISVYVNKSFDNIPFEQLLYSIMTSKGTSFSAIFQGFVFVLVGTFITLTILFIINKIVLRIKTNIYINFTFKEKIFSLNSLSLIKNSVWIIFVIISIHSSINLLNIDEYINSQINSSKIFDEYYVDSNNVKITFPKDKQNLIYIYVESLEMTNATIENGEHFKKHIFPI